MTVGGFRADPGRIERLAGRIGRVAGVVGAARPSGAALSADAFGLVGGVFVGAVTAATGAGAEAVTRVGRRLQGTSEALVATAAGYRSVDAAAARSFTGVEVPRAPSSGGAV